jgi:hypothetical protein
MGRCLSLTMSLARILCQANLELQVSITSSVNHTIERIKKSTSFGAANMAENVPLSELSLINDKLLNYRVSGSSSGPSIVFVHGLGESVLSVESFYV